MRGIEQRQGTFEVEDADLARVGFIDHHAQRNSRAGSFSFKYSWHLSLAYTYFSGRNKMQLS